jgi:hypothetical protein
MDKPTEIINPERARTEKDRKDCLHFVVFEGMCLDCMQIVDSNAHKR